MKRALLALAVLLGTLSMTATPASAGPTCERALRDSQWMANSFRSTFRPSLDCVTPAELAADLSVWYTPEEISIIVGYYIYPANDTHAIDNQGYWLTRYIFAHEMGHAADRAAGHKQWPSAQYPRISDAMPGMGVEGYAAWFAYLVTGDGSYEQRPYFSPDQIRSWQALGWLPYGTRVACSNGTCARYINMAGIR